MGHPVAWKNLIGQSRIKEALSTAFSNNSLAHAYLFSGDPGVGKFQAALELSLALLCESTAEKPCYTCPSCRQVLTYAHTDFHLLFPVALEATHKRSGDASKLTEEGWEYIAREARSKLSDPYLLNESRLRTLPVDWIRELNHAIMRGAVQKKSNVVIICDVDIMKKESANAMLKTLEEPPPGTVILLLTSRLFAVLPTIRSRCQIMRFGSLSPRDIAAALAAAYGKDPQDRQITCAVESAIGSYGRARNLIEESLEVYLEQARKLWDLCLKNSSWSTLATTLEQINEDHLGGGWDYGAAEKFLLSFLPIIRRTFFYNIHGTEKYFMGSEPVPTIEGFNIAAADKLYAQCERAVANVRARGNVLLVVVNFILSVLEIIHGKSK